MLATKTIHVKVVSDVSSKTFLLAYRIRFTTGDIIQKSNVQDKVATIETQWHFIPPAAPHFGGIWEAGLKSMKYPLKRIIETSTLTYEKLITLTSQIEACLNFRLLCRLTDEIAALTSGHFLIGKELVTPGRPTSTNYDNYLSLR